jgi:hypothetical protein
MTSDTSGNPNVKEFLSELKDACHSEPSPSDVETIRRGESTWFRGRPAHAPEGTIALALSDDARVIINDGDVRAVEKQGEHYSVEVSADTHVLLRIDKLLKATVERGCVRGESPSPTMQKRDGGGPDIELVVVEVCDLVCGDVVLGGIRTPVCVPVNCKKYQ